MDRFFQPQRVHGVRQAVGERALVGVHATTRDVGRRPRRRVVRLRVVVGVVLVADAERARDPAVERVLERLADAADRAGRQHLQLRARIQVRNLDAVDLQVAATACVLGDGAEHRHLRLHHRVVVAFLGTDRPEGEVRRQLGLDRRGVARVDDGVLQRDLMELAPHVCLFQRGRHRCDTARHVGARLLHQVDDLQPAPRLAERHTAPPVRLLEVERVGLMRLADVRGDWHATAVALDAAAQASRVHLAHRVRQAITVDGLDARVVRAAVVGPLSGAEVFASGERHAQAQADQAGEVRGPRRVAPVLLALGPQHELGLDLLLELVGPHVIHAEHGVHRVGVEAEVRADDRVAVDERRALHRADVAQQVIAARIHQLLVDLRHRAVGGQHARAERVEFSAEAVSAFVAAAHRLFARDEFAVDQGHQNRTPAGRLGRMIPNGHMPSRSRSQLM